MTNLMMNHKGIILLLTLLLSSVLNARQSGIPDKTKRQPSDNLQKAAGNPRYAILNINNLTTWHRSDGLSNRSPQGNNGLYFPRGTGPVVFQDGLVWGGKLFLDSAKTVPVNFHPIRVGGATYGTGTRAGRVIGFGANATPKNPNDADVRIFRIRRDYSVMSTEELRRDAAEVNEIPVTLVTTAQMEAVRAQYELDWAEWPANYGAPYIERNAVQGFQAPPPFLPGFTKDSLVSGHYDEPGLGTFNTNNPADQVLWTVFNDLNESQALGFASSEPLGLEIQKTVWGYKASDARGNMYFSRYRFINKGGVDTSASPGFQGGSFFVDSMYVSLHTSYELGNFIDDLGGCDTLIDLAFVYNKSASDITFSTFGLSPPSFGTVFLQGGLIPSFPDTAYFNLKKRLGFGNLHMTSVSRWGPGSPYSDPPNGVPGGYNGTSGQWWKILRGFAPIGSFSTSDVPYAAPPGADPKFMYSGDPTLQTGWLDGQGTLYSFGGGDARILMNSGPFALAPGDTQEIVFAYVGGLGADRLSSVTIMKSTAALARKMHTNLFASPRPPREPAVKVVELDHQIVLNWAFDQQRISETEESVLGDYRFEGYNVYQLPSTGSRLSEGIKLATFDENNGIKIITDQYYDPTLKYFPLAVLQSGTDSGIRRYLRITRDWLKNPGGQALLNNGVDYIFAVTAYNYSDISPRSLQSNPVIVIAKPQIAFGISSQISPGDTLTSMHPQGSSAGTVFPIILDPTSGTGDTYEVRFDTSAATVSWSVFNLTQNRLVITGQTNQSGDEDYPILEGILLKVVDDPAATQKNSPSDTFRYTVPGVRRDQNTIKASIQRIGVFPNPYYSAREQETTTWRKFVTFNNLPPKATIRIFNLAGHLVRTLQKDDQSQFFEWDLTNESNWQVASGIYVCYVEMPEIGETKVLKLAVIQPQIVPGR